MVISISGTFSGTSLNIGHPCQTSNDPTCVVTRLTVVLILGTFLAIPGDSGLQISALVWRVPCGMKQRRNLSSLYSHIWMNYPSGSHNVARETHTCLMVWGSKVINLTNRFDIYFYDLIQCGWKGLIVENRGTGNCPDWTPYQLGDLIIRITSVSMIALVK